MGRGIILDDANMIVHNGEISNDLWFRFGRKIVAALETCELRNSTLSSGSLATFARLTPSLERIFSFDPEKSPSGGPFPSW